MNIPEFDYQVLRLTDRFYECYHPKDYPEIMGKRGRAYSCLLIETHFDFFIAIPFRTEIKHKYAFHFRKSKRFRDHHSGLDYTKMIIIKNPEFVETKEAEVDSDEYAEMRNKIYVIVKGALSYLEDYLLHQNGKMEVH